MKERILVTGGTGYIGSHTVVELQNSGYEVIIIDNLSNSSADVVDNIEKVSGIRPVFEKLDCLDFAGLDAIFAKYKGIKAIIHFAASKAVGESVEKPLLYYRNNLVSLINLLELMPKHGVEGIVFSSSCTVYGQPDELPVTEKAPIKKAESPYGNTKQINEEIIIRPAFGGNIVATIVNPEHRPQMATVREGVMKKEILDENYKGEVVNHDVAKFVPETDYVVKVIDRHVEKAKHNLKGAPIVIAGGYGMGSKEGFDKLFELAKELHAEVGASRAAVDAGYADHDRQIGQTGVTVRPKLYIACGISGQIQHIAGMQDAGIIISVNSDPNAPINTIADYVINGTVEEVVPKLIKYYKKNSK